MVINRGFLSLKQSFKPSLTFPSFASKARLVLKEQGGESYSNV